jgi:isopentenyldiphosphate isomerase
VDELLDIVNEQDQVIAQEFRSEIYAKRLSCFRVINAFLINDSKQLWIPRRTKNKKLFPLCLDASVGGHVNAGESYQQAFERELKEELNLNAGHCSYKAIAKLTPHEHGVSAFMHLYMIYTNITPSYNLEDFDSAEWLLLHEIEEKIKGGIAIKGDFPLLIKALKNFL